MRFNREEFNEKFSVTDDIEVDGLLDIARKVKEVYPNAKRIRINPSPHSDYAMPDDWDAYCYDILIDTDTTYGKTVGICNFYQDAAEAGWNAICNAQYDQAYKLANEFNKRIDGKVENVDVQLNTKDKIYIAHITLDKTVELDEPEGLMSELTELLL
jgi:hypothetical protein